MNIRSFATALKKLFPIVEWLPHYRSGWLRFDLIAAVSVWALLVPQGIAYASIAGVPAQYGLYAALGALVGYALFGSSGQVVTGPSAAVAAVSASVIALWAKSGSSQWIAYTATLAVAAGLVYLLLGLLRMGWISHFLSGAVLAGFVFGFGFGLIVDQLPKILGVPKAHGESYFRVLVEAVKDIPDASLVTIAVGVLSILLLLAFRRFWPKLPRTIVVVVLGIVVSGLLNLQDHGVEIVGKVPTGLPSFVWPALPKVPLAEVVLGALAIIFIGYSESLAAAKQEGAKHDYEIDASQEMVAQGAANAGAGLLGGFAVEGSLSKTTVADTAGQKTQLASLFTAGLILLTIVLLAGFFTNLPDAVLGAVVIDAGISLIKFKEFRYYRLSSRDFAAFAATALVVFFGGVLAGVIAGVAISLLLLIVSASKTPTQQLAFDRKDNTYVRVINHPEAQLIPGVLVVSVHGPLFFADADNFLDAVAQLVKSNSPHTVVVDLAHVSVMDMDGVRALSKLTQDLQGKHVTVLLAGVGKDHTQLLRETGTLDQIGAGNLYQTVREAVASAQQAAEAPDESPQPS